MTHLKEVCDPLGANLVLAASAVPGTKDFQLFLRVLDPSQVSHSGRRNSPALQQRSPRSRVKLFTPRLRYST